MYPTHNHAHNHVHSHPYSCTPLTYPTHKHSFAEAGKFSVINLLNHVHNHAHYAHKHATTMPTTMLTTVPQSYSHTPLTSILMYPTHIHAAASMLTYPTHKHSFAEAGKFSVINLLNHVHNDPPKKVPDNGIVSELCVNVSNIFSAAYEYYKVSKKRNFIAIDSIVAVSFIILLLLGGLMLQQIGQVLYIKGGAPLEDQRHDIGGLGLFFPIFRLFIALGLFLQISASSSATLQDCWRGPKRISIVHL
jgi:hypothetical protein